MHDDEMFCHRYRVSRKILTLIFNEETGTDRYFQQKKDACGKMGILQLLKLSAGFRTLAYRVAYEDYMNL